MIFFWNTALFCSQVFKTRTVSKLKLFSEKPPPGERDCTKDELTTCEDKLCEDVDSCYAVCYANGDRFKCGCDIEMAIFDKEKCVPFDQGEINFK